MASETEAGNEQMPSIEFLEFIGTGTKVGDEYLDPLNYSEIGSDARDNTLPENANSKKHQDDK